MTQVNYLKWLGLDGWKLPAIKNNEIAEGDVYRSHPYHLPMKLITIPRWLVQYRPSAFVEMEATY